MIAQQDVIHKRYLKKAKVKVDNTLLTVLLLLLMAGDCEEEKNTALLTLALYFFM